MKRERLQQGIKRAVDWLLADQDHQDGFWVGKLESNSCMEAEWIQAMHILDIRDDPKYDGVVQAILNDQRSDGSWDVYYDAPTGDINTTVESYAALRIAGIDPQGKPLVRARQWILENGGLSGTRVFTRYWLALLGEWPWKYTPALPPEIIFIPTWAPFNLYQFASWARATMLPLAILSARRPVHPASPGRRLDEIFPDGRDNFDFRLPRKNGPVSWERFFLITDCGLNSYVNFPFLPFREAAICQCREWIVQHQEADGAWGGIQPPWIYSLMALHAEGYATDHPVMAAGIDAFNHRWSYERDGGIYLQPCVSPIWDTVLVLLAFLDCEMPPGTEAAAEKAVKFLLKEQVLVTGDWQVLVKDIEPGGWAFEFENDKYPDVDDTAVAVIVLLMLLPWMKSRKLREQTQSAVDRAIGWLLGMQNKNGGWAAFDRDNTSKFLTLIPFADFGELLDPPSVDVTAHVVEALGLYGKTIADPVVAKACRYIRMEQEEDGPWFGRWGVNYIYGTAAVLPALEAVGENLQADFVQRAVRWLVDHQNEDGGWGESCGSYMDDRLRGRGPSTASQTGWALMALIAAGSHDFDRNISRGLEFLLASQRHDGTW
ncbi:MAG: squalene--hopene cyclase, partial [Desulfobulbaceae bacterium]|nr:squalene--hopene cyclase [Desulfobulbaceae bacterium]